MTIINLLRHILESTDSARSFVVSVDFAPRHRIPRPEDTGIQPNTARIFPHKGENLLRFSVQVGIRLEQVGVLSNREADMLNDPGGVNKRHNRVSHVLADEVCPRTVVLGQNSLSPCRGDLAPVVMP